MTTLDLTDEETAALTGLLADAIDGDHVDADQGQHRKMVALGGERT